MKRPPIRSSLLPAAIAIAFLIFAAGSYAFQQSANPSTNQPAQPSPGKAAQMHAMESMLVSRIHMVNQMEIRAGAMAAKKGSIFAVREYGDRLQLDHKMADRKVLAYAAAHHLQVLPPDQIEMKLQQMSAMAPEAETTPPQIQQQGMSPQSTVPPAQQFKQQMDTVKTTMQQLQTLQGNAFDEAFAQFMQKGHTQAIAMLSMAEQTFRNDSSLHSMLSKFVSVLDQHYEMASALEISAVRRQNSQLGAHLSAMMMKGGH
jgi:predicted outer membrane protein